MRKLLLIFFLLNTLFVRSQTKAITDEGRQVILMEDGTWKYDNDSNEVKLENDTIKLNPNGFYKAKGETFLLKSKNVNIGIYLNPSKWIFKPHRENETTPEYRFESKSGDAYAMLITEKTEIDLENLRSLALQNAQSAAADTRIVQQEYRIVNGEKLLYLQMRGTVKGIKFVYEGYYFSDDSGTTQFVSYSDQKQFNKVRPELQEFLNGFVRIKR